MINLFQPSLSSEEVLALSNTIETNWLGRGPVAAQFESAWAQHIGVQPAQCLAITSATEGLFTIFQMILSPGDEVIIPAIHFVGVANAVCAAGGKPVFCDVDKRTLNATAQFVADRMTDKTRAVCVLHYGGYPCEIDEIAILCSIADVYLIEDSANSPASTYKGKACGTRGDFGIWSFDAMKVMSTGDGGMLYCRNPEFIIDKAKKMLYLGLDETSGLSSTRSNWWEYQVSMPGRRGLMNDLTASIGLEQLKKLSEFCAIRSYISFRYDETLRGLPIDIYPVYPKEASPSFYFYPIQLANQENRDGLARYLREHAIYTSFRYYPLHRVEFFSHDGYPLPGADYAADRTLLLPLHQSLTLDNIEIICGHIRDYFSR